MEIKVTLNEVESKALSYLALDPQDYVEHAIKESCRLAIDEIFQQEIARMAQDPSVLTIPADKNSVVLAANIKTAKERQELLDAMPVLPLPEES
jgi:hypothetical protein